MLNKLRNKIKLSKKKKRLKKQFLYSPIFLGILWGIIEYKLYNDKSSRILTRNSFFSDLIFKNIFNLIPKKILMSIILIFYSSKIENQSNFFKKSVFMSGLVFIFLILNDIFDILINIHTVGKLFNNSFDIITPVANTENDIDLTLAGTFLGFFNLIIPIIIGIIIKSQELTNNGLLNVIQDIKKIFSHLYLQLEPFIPFFFGIEISRIVTNLFGLDVSYSEEIVTLLQKFVILLQYNLLLPSLISIITFIITKKNLIKLMKNYKISLMTSLLSPKGTIFSLLFDFDKFNINNNIKITIALLFPLFYHLKNLNILSSLLKAKTLGIDLTNLNKITIIILNTINRIHKLVEIKEGIRNIDTQFLNTKIDESFGIPTEQLFKQTGSWNSISKISNIWIICCFVEILKKII
jgi:hypothetical protein